MSRWRRAREARSERPAPPKEPVPWWIELPVWTAIFTIGWLVFTELGAIPLEFRIVAVGVAALVVLRGAATLWDARERGPGPAALRASQGGAAAVCAAGIATYAQLGGPAAAVGLAALLAVNLGVNRWQHARHGRG